MLIFTRFYNTNQSVIMLDYHIRKATYCLLLEKYLSTTIGIPFYTTLFYILDMFNLGRYIHTYVNTCIHTFYWHEKAMR